MKQRKVLANEAKIPDSRLEGLLLDIVNARVIETRFRAAKHTEGKEEPELQFDVIGTEDDTDDIFKRYSKYLPYAPKTPQELRYNSSLLMAFRRRWRVFHFFIPKQVEVYRRGIIAEVRDHLRTIWELGDVEARNWRLKSFQSFMNDIMAAGPASGRLQPDAMAPSALPPDSPMSQALSFLGRKVNLLKICANPECPRPFLIASRADQKVCDLPECAKAMRRASKKRYWDIKLERPGKGEKPTGGSSAKESGTMGGEVQVQHPKISKGDIEKFVLDVVNADKTKIDNRKLYFFIQYPKFFPTWEGDVEAVVLLAGNNPVMLEKMKKEWPEIYHRGLMRDLHEGLRGIWHTGDESVAGRLLFKLQSVMHRDVDLSRGSDKSLPPQSHPIQQALQWVGEHLSKLRRCRNVKCPGPHPFFVAKTKEVFCSAACSHVGEKESKRHSWKKNKARWRRKPSKG
jgi:hypothetical protein